MFGGTVTGGVAAAEPTAPVDAPETGAVPPAAPDPGGVVVAGDGPVVAVDPELLCWGGPVPEARTCVGVNDGLFEPVAPPDELPVKIHAVTPPGLGLCVIAPSGLNVQVAWPGMAYQ